MARRWVVERTAGSAAAFHERAVALPAARAVWQFTVTEPAVALGSAQPLAHVDDAAARDRGLVIVRRRSGGGAVLLRPGDPLWIDVVIPRDDPLWLDDVGRSSWWLGETWRRALGTLGVPLGDVDVHRGPLQRTEWSDRVCFAGLGAGEVSVGSRKVVGVSQRRTRHAARFQCAALLHWDPAPLIDMLALSPEERRRSLDDVSPRAVGIAALLPSGTGTPGASRPPLTELADRVADAFVAALPD
jgi:lipoate-protein ligase A